jgi:hypothetical protein
MNDTKNLTILILCITAVVLLAMVIGVKMDSTAYAGGIGMKQGNWIMVAGGATSKSDMLYMVDIGQRQMNVYGLTGKKIEKIDAINLDDIFAAEKPK